MIIGGSGNVEGTGKAAQDGAKLAEDLNQFLNLLTTQLKNQDPLDPMDANEFTQQLVSFASVEQQIYQNSNLEKLLNVQQTSQISSMVNFIGKRIEAPSDQLPLENGNAEFTYEVGADANKVFINVRDADGLSVYAIDGETSSGKHNVAWDGKDKNGTQMPDGTYTLYVQALDRLGDSVDVSQTVFGTVSGATGEDGALELLIGDDIGVPMGNVVSVKK